MSRVAAILGASCAASLASCIQFSYHREIIENQPAAREVDAFAVGRPSLSEVLNVLGAPIDVFEGADGAPAVTYGGLRSGAWLWNFSLPLSDYTSASFSYTDTSARTRGFILIFDTNERLAIVREGLLGDLREEFMRRPPASVDGDVPGAVPGTAEGDQP